jgi:glycosyltransferase involved in cell wall biosynthesis
MRSPRKDVRRDAADPTDTADPAAATPPRATVAICTYDRYDLLRQAVATLGAQTMPADQFEILVIDNSPDAGRSAEEGATYADIGNLIWVYEATPGLSNARNVAMRAARAPIIAYLDDDAFTEPDWLEKLLLAYDTLGEEAFGIGGRVLPLFLGERPPWLADRLLGYLSVVDIGGETRFLEDHEWVAGANVSYRVERLREAGGFSPALGRIGSGIALMSNDETELAERLAKLGGRMGYAPAASVQHCVDPSRLTQEWFRRRIAWQAVSDYVRDPKGLRNSAENHWRDVKVFLAHQPPQHRTLRALALEQEKPGDLVWQMSAIYASIVSLLSGIGESHE